MSPKKVLAVFGATGTQGNSVIQYVLSSPLLSSQFSLRALTRDPSSPFAKKALQLPHASTDLEIVAADHTVRSTLVTALTGVHTAFVMTPPSVQPDTEAAVATEFGWVKTIADVAVEVGVEYLIYASLADVLGISGGKYKRVAPFDAKAKAEEYIRGLSKEGKIKSSFFVAGWFMHTYLPPLRVPGTEDEWVIRRTTSPQTQLPMINAVEDSGKFVGSILADPKRFEGVTIWAAERIYTVQEVVDIMARVTGKKITYQQISDEELVEDLHKIGGATATLAAVYIDGFRFGEEFGLFGPNTPEKVAWAVKNAVREGDKLGTVEEFFTKNPPVFDRGDLSY